LFSKGHISGALAELIRSTRAATKDRLIGKIMGGNPVFRGTRVPVHMLAELVPSRACRTTAQQLQHGVEGAISNGTRTADLGGAASTSAFTKAVIAAMRNADVAA
jgi:hypothetical protein